jgi:2-methylcitrate dehydratase PrpD
MASRSIGLTARIAEHVAAVSYADLPPATVRAAKRALLDGIGVMLAASGTSDDVAPFASLATAWCADGTATIIGHGRRTTPALAAMANGAMAHALDFEDAFDLAPVHPNASLIPAALAVAEAHGPVSGRDLVAAVAMGCDLVCRLGLSLRRRMEDGGWYPPPILGSVGAAAAAARLMRLSPREVADAFSLLLCQVSCPGEIKYDADTVIRAVREAFPAQAAVTAAELAARGVRGFDRPFEGKAGFFRLYVDGQYDEAPLLDGLGERYWIERLSIKPWPACRGTHACIEAMLHLVMTHGIAWRDVREIRLEGGEVQHMLVEPAERKQRPANAIDAKFSLPFTAAVALVRGRVTLEDFLPAALADPDVLAAAALVDYRHRPEWGRDRLASGSVELLLADGRSVRAEVEEPRGGPDRPLSDAELKDKFADCAARASNRPSGQKIDDIAARILALEEETDVAALIAAL